MAIRHNRKLPSCEKERGRRSNTKAKGEEGNGELEKIEEVR